MGGERIRERGLGSVEGTDLVVGGCEAGGGELLGGASFGIGCHFRWGRRRIPGFELEAACGQAGWKGDVMWL